MLKVGKCLTKEELLKENYELGQKVAKLEIQIETLKDVMINRGLKPVCPVMQPYVWPGVLRDTIPSVWPYMPNDTTGDPLPAQPNTTVCYDSVGTKVYDD